MSVERLGKIMADLNALGSSEGYAENTLCPGALLRLTRKEADTMDRNGVRFVEVWQRMPPEGRHPMRLHCRGEVMSVQKSTDLNRGQSEEEHRVFWTVTYGLCARCNGYELAMRTRMKQEADQAAQGQRTAKKFGEAAE